MSAEVSDQQRQYREIYLRSDHWRQMRALSLEDADHRCAVCNAAKHLDVHHRTYERLGDERLTDLLVLCRTCHDIFHQGGRLAGSRGRPQSSKPKPKKKKQKRVGYTRPKARQVSKEIRQVEIINDRLERVQRMNREKRAIRLAAAAPPAPPPQRLQHEPLPPRHLRGATRRVGRGGVKLRTTGDAA